MQALLTRTEVDGRIELVGVGAMTGAVALMGIVGVALHIYARTLRNCIATWCLCSLRRHVEEACRLRVLRLLTAIPRVRMHSCLDLRPGLCRLKRGVKGLTGKTGPGLKIGTWSESQEECSSSPCRTCMSQSSSSSQAASSPSG